MNYIEVSEALYTKMYMLATIQLEFHPTDIAYI